MEIKSDLSKKFFTCSNEAIGVNLDKKSILKYKKNSTYTYTEHNILIFIILLLTATILTLIKTKTTLVLSYLFLLLALIQFITSIAILLISYYIRRNNLINKIIIDKEGITDNSFYGMKITFSWKKITAIVERAHTTVVLTDTPVYFYFPRSKTRTLEREIKKHKKDILIIK